MRKSLLLFLVVGFLPSASTPQDPAPQNKLSGTIRVDVTFVPVTVLVTDGKGKPVTDLKKDDFFVAEDGVAQDISHFSITSLGPGVSPRSL